MIRVVDSTTGLALEGGTSCGLLHASRNAGSSGIVAAYRDESWLWLHVPLTEAEHHRSLGHEIRLVRVEER